MYNETQPIQFIISIYKSSLLYKQFLCPLTKIKASHEMVRIYVYFRFLLKHIKHKRLRLRPVML